MDREICYDDVQRTFRSFTHVYDTWRVQQLPANESIPTDGWSRINVRPVDYATYKLQYICARCSNTWTSNRHTYILFKFNRLRRQIKMRVYGQQCLSCHSTFFIKPCYNEAQLRDAIDYIIDKMTNRHIVIGNGGNRRSTGQYSEAKLNQACEACRFDLCQNSLTD